MLNSVSSFWSKVLFWCLGDYLQKVILSLVAPVGLRQQPSIHEMPYFTMFQSYDEELQVQNGRWEGYEERKKNITIKIKDKSK